ncbi:MAG TPA: serine hydrolase [Bdellovibrionota bacterium]|jgi:hypothetical protein
MRPTLVLLFLALLSQPAWSLETAQIKAIYCPPGGKVDDKYSKYFDHEYLEHGGFEELRQILQDQNRQFGKCLELKSISSTEFELEYKEASVPLDLVHESGKKIKGNFFGMPRIRNDSLKKLEEDLKREPYAVSFYAGLEDGKELFSRNADKPMSISRANQIFLLRAVQDGVASGKLKLSDLVSLDTERAVRTMGIIHYWKDGTQISLDSLLNLMVTEKDLSASDLILSRMEKGAFKGYSKGLDSFPSFREYFILAARDKEKIGSRAQAAKLISGLKNEPLPELYRTDRLELVDTLGWFASARDLCASALSVKDDILVRNARLSKEYQSVQSKQIEKYGIVQTRDSGISQVTVVFKLVSSPKWGCISVTANHSDEIEEALFSTLDSRLLNLVLAQGAN